MRRTLHAVLLAALSHVACVGQDVDQAWHVGEIRLVHAEPSLPSGGSDFEVAVPIGVERDALTLAASESLSIGRGAAILEIDREERKGQKPPFGLVFSAGALRIDPDAQLGSVYAAGPAAPALAPGLLIHGFLRAAARVNVSGPWRAEQGVLDDAPDYIEEFDWHVDFAPAGGRYRVSHAFDRDDLRVEPGTYESLRVESGSTMFVTTGHYEVRSLALEPHADLIVDNTKGPVYIWVRDSLSIEGSIVDLSLQPTLLFGYAGSETPKLASRFRGTLVAPRASIRLPATPEPHGGSFFARDVIVADGAVIEHRAFAGVRAEQEQPSAVCTACVVDQALANRACADSRVRATHSLDEEAAACLALCQTHASPDIDACRADCSQQSEREKALLPDRFEACTESARRAMGTCEHRAHYRAGACWYLGYALDLH